ncbi:nucleoside phosphorylase [Raineyella fluvialis]|uniref:Uridine phosphorylase n=1 Tax=Raineyella fluvialis TaxID=2662261 RepID=A0A5Q2FA32_9ACTN|nr:nucleoside phosphorylase [Raineyella fluvialis]QGF23830.1 purine-nucleoside phosphorylase [Raineyella fluvialis]
MEPEPSFPLDTEAELADDLEQEGFLEPSALYERVDVPESVVLAFLPQTVREVGDREGSTVSRTIGDILEPRPLYEREHRGVRVGWCYPSMGAPHTAMVMEELIARGVRRFIAVGSAGVLRPELVMGHPFVVTSALRDEGTSSQYLTPSAVVEADPLGVRACREALVEGGIGFSTGRTWTTDAIYRETRGRVRRRMDQGCAVVEMEAAAMLAVARYRGVGFGQILFGADSLAGEAWESRAWPTAAAVHEAMFWWAMDAAARLGELEAAGGKSRQP